MLSGRFDGEEAEYRLREVAAELERRGIRSYVVTAKGGSQFGDQTNVGLYGMYVMLAFCYPHYGQKTTSPYCSYIEVKHAIDHHIPIIPIKMYDGDDWPPHPPDKLDGGCKGAAQNLAAFPPDLVYLDWGPSAKNKDESPKVWSAAACVDELMETGQIRPRRAP